MPITGKPAKGSKIESGKVWRTVRGRKVQLDPKKNIQEQIRDSLGEEYTTKRQNRTGLTINHFKIKDEVYFDDFTKQGTIYGIDNKTVKILSDGLRFLKHINSVFKSDETFDIDNIHWDAINKAERSNVLKGAGVLSSYASTDWCILPTYIQKTIIQKYSGGAGGGPGASGFDSGGISTGTTGTFNPVYEETTINDIIRRAKDEKKE